MFTNAIVESRSFLKVLPRDLTWFLKAEPGKLDIKRHEQGFIFISLLIPNPNSKNVRGWHICPKHIFNKDL